MPVNPQQVQQVFQAVLDAARAERALVLERNCAGDAELRQRVEELLQAHDDSAELPAVDVTGAYAARPAPAMVRGTKRANR